ncbi:hypothetical protein [Phenylobacterium sp.]|uniref:hypothetical protein n=1 Tax=Phenylobacterium sp. TaxID=1871053 RepID=UPI0027323E0C|nr:hypothetical protein [Phenylobacterium sp.]MDP3661215.1 hypothetical protein [Phenylobacterium sp.]
MTPSFAKLARATPTHVAFAFLAMGGWALFANRGHGQAAWTAALGQGAMSGVITLLLKRALEAMAARLSGVIAYLAPPALSASLILVLLYAAHRAIGTPQIAATIAVPWSVSTLYAILYTATLVRARNGTPGS